MNKCIFIGRLTYDPEVNHTTSGKRVCNFTVAVNEGKDRVEFIDCAAWEDRADFVAKHFKKGKPIAVDCSHRTDRWEDKESGEARKSVKYVVNNVSFVPGSNDSGKPKSDNVSSEPDSDSNEEDEDVPF